MVWDWNWQHVREVLVKSNDNDNIENKMCDEDDSHWLHYLPFYNGCGDTIWGRPQVTIGRWRQLPHCWPHTHYDYGWRMNNRGDGGRVWKKSDGSEIELLLLTPIKRCCDPFHSFFFFLDKIRASAAPQHKSNASLYCCSFSLERTGICVYVWLRTCGFRSDFVYSAFFFVLAIIHAYPSIYLCVCGKQRKQTNGLCLVKTNCHNSWCETKGYGLCIVYIWLGLFFCCKYKSPLGSSNLSVMRSDGVFVLAIQHGIVNESFYS